MAQSQSLLPAWHNSTYVGNTTFGNFPADVWQAPANDPVRYPFANIITSSDGFQLLLALFANPGYLRNVLVNV